MIEKTCITNLIATRSSTNNSYFLEYCLAYQTTIGSQAYKNKLRRAAEHDKRPQTFQSLRITRKQPDQGDSNIAAESRDDKGRLYFLCGTFDATNIRVRAKFSTPQCGRNHFRAARL